MAPNGSGRTCGIEPEQPRDAVGRATRVVGQMRDLVEIAHDPGTVPHRQRRDEHAQTRNAERRRIEIELVTKVDALDAETRQVPDQPLGVRERHACRERTAAARFDMPGHRAGFPWLEHLDLGVADREHDAAGAEDGHFVPSHHFGVEQAAPVARRRLGITDGQHDPIDPLQHRFPPARSFGRS